MKIFKLLAHSLTHQKELAESSSLVARMADVDEALRLAEAEASKYTEELLTLGSRLAGAKELHSPLMQAVRDKLRTQITELERKQMAPVEKLKAEKAELARRNENLTLPVINSLVRRQPELLEYGRRQYQEAIGNPIPATDPKERAVTLYDITTNQPSLEKYKDFVIKSVEEVRRMSRKSLAEVEEAISERLQAMEDFDFSETETVTTTGGTLRADKAEARPDIGVDAARVAELAGRISKLERRI